MPGRQETRTANFLKFFSQGEEEVGIASLASWNAQLKGLAEFEKKVSTCGAGSEIIKRKRRSIEGHGGRQNPVAEQSNGKVLRADFFEEMKELEEKKSKGALLLVQRKHILMRYQNERDEARRL